MSDGDAGTEKDAAAKGRVTGLLQWYAHASTAHPWRCLASVTVGVLIIVMATGGAVEMAEQGDYDWMQFKSEAVQNAIMLGASQFDSESVNVVPERSVPEETQTLVLFYEAQGDDDTVLSEAGLEVMLDTEMSVMSSGDFTQFCVVDDAGECRPPLTVLGLFYEMDAESDSWSKLPLGCEGDDCYVSDALREQTLRDFAASDRFEAMQLLYGSEFSADNPRTKIVRSIYQLGLPLRGFANPTDNNELQVEKGNEYLIEVSASLRDKFGLAPTFFRTAMSSRVYTDAADGMEVEVAWFAGGLMSEEFNEVSFKDLSWVVMCFVTVGSYMWFHTGSLIISAIGMLEIIFALLVGAFFTSVICQVSYFQFLNSLIIFVVLGVGADDVFVFVDAFYQSRVSLTLTGDVAVDTENRVNFALQRSARAIWITSFTTAVAFFATATSDLVPLRSFGIFSGWVILSVYSLNVMIMPPLLALWSANLEGKPALAGCGHCLSCRCRAPPKGAAKPIDIELTDKGGGEGEGASGEPKPAASGAQLRMVERFFEGPFADTIFKLRYGILAFFAALFILGVVLFSQLHVPQEPEQYLPSTHMFEHIRTLGGRFNGRTAEEYLNPVVVWGMKGLDMSTAKQWEPNHVPDVEYDLDFDLSSAAAQRQVQAVAQQMSVSPCDLDLCSNGMKMLNPVTTFLEAFYSWAWLDELAAIRASQAEDAGDDVAAAEAAARLCGGSACSGFSLAEDGTALEGTDFMRKLCEFASMQSTNMLFPGHVGFTTTDDCAGETREGGAPPRLKHALVTGSSSVAMPAPPGFICDKLQPMWYDFINDLNNKASDELAAVGMAGAKVASQNIFWLWCNTSKSIVSGMFTGMAICIPVVFVVLFFSTFSLIMALYATLTIFGIITSVLGIGVSGVMSWDLGTPESVAAVIIIGFSVDYCVHIANAYIESPKESQRERTREAITTMGISVTAGAITTALSGAWLWACTMIFFVKFAFLIVWTIFVSFFWAIVFFPALLMLVGPSSKGQKMGL